MVKSTPAGRHLLQPCAASVLVPDDYATGEWFPCPDPAVDFTGSHPLCVRHVHEAEVSLWKALLGDLIDALHDELLLEVFDNDHVLGFVTRAARELGDGYEPYAESWI